MRYNLRATRAIAFTVFLVAILYLCQSHKLPTSLEDLPHFHNDESQSAAASPTLDFHGEIRVLWRHWAKIIHDACPRMEPIILSSNAHIESVPFTDRGPRQAPTDYVANSASDIASLRSSHAGFLDAIQSEDIHRDVYNGMGVVTMGGGEYFGPAIIGLHMLRKTGCSLPVEIFVADQTEYEAGLCEEYLPKFGATCLVLSDFLKAGDAADNFKVTHYQLKSLAMLFSSFAEILYLDSDSIPLFDPSTEFFSTEPYKSSGLVIWPDFWVATESPLFWTIAGFKSFPSSLPKSSSEAGQLLMNKKTHLKSLLLAVYYNIYGPDYYYPLLSQGVLGQGDKETFMAAALVTGDPYYRVVTAVASIGRDDGREFRGSGMIQHHPFDDYLLAQPQNSSSDSDSNVKVRPAFMHANTPKMNAGHLVDEGDLFTTSHDRLRLWGAKESQEIFFGVDLEKQVWKLLLETGCELENVIAEWVKREGVCRRLEEHWNAIFGV